MRRVDFQKMRGLVPAVVQHYRTREVLMVGFVNRKALRKMEKTGLLWFWSRQKKRLWQKGETTGHIHHIIDIATDCDRDTLLIRVRPAGPTCHTGRASCFSGAHKLKNVSN